MFTCKKLLLFAGFCCHFYNKEPESRQVHYHQTSRKQTLSIPWRFCTSKMQELYRTELSFYQQESVIQNCVLGDVQLYLKKRLLQIEPLPMTPNISYNASMFLGISLHITDAGYLKLLEFFYVTTYFTR